MPRARRQVVVREQPDDFNASKASLAFSINADAAALMRAWKPWRKGRAVQAGR